MDQPRGADYLEALQHPATAFADPELAAGTVELTALGLPRPVSGNVASVFKVTGSTGRTYAVRCFVRRFDDVTARYDAIVRRLADVDATWKVDLDFQAAGVQVDGRWFPVVKMEWSDAVPLLPWIEAHLWDTAALSYAAVRFASLVASMRAAGIAHGDLQHGNILVAPGGDLRLVDYDGMYVPELEGMGSNELGHRNYAHPARTRDDFGPHLDAFPGWVVYASLAALSIDPLLWGRLDGGDECLLFRAADFADPTRSEALACLRAAGDPRLAALAAVVEQQVHRPVAAVSPLSLAVAPPPALELAHDRSGGSMARLRERQSLMEVLRTASTPLPTTAPVVDETPAAAVPQLVFAPRPFAALRDRVAGRLTRRRRPAAQSSTPEHVAAAAAQQRVDDLEQARRTVDEEEQRAAERHTRMEAELRHREQVELQGIDDELKRVLSDLAAREHDLYRAERHEQADALRAVQAHVLDGELARHRLVSARVAGIDDKLAYGLALDDIRTAADIAEVLVDGDVFIVRPDGHRVRTSSLGADQARVLLGWRRQLEVRYQHLLPTVLPDERAVPIREAYSAKRAALEEEGTRVRVDAAAKANGVRALVSAEHDRRTAELRDAKQAAAARRLELDRELGRARKDAAEARFRLTAIERDTAVRH